jgi:hypothetical protein
MADGQAGGRTAAPRHPDDGIGIEPGSAWEPARLEAPSGDIKYLLNQSLKPYGLHLQRGAGHGTAIA